MNMTFLIVTGVFLILLISGVIIFLLYQVYVKSTQGVISRLRDEVDKASAKQNELDQKLKEADEELNKRQVEAREVAAKLQSSVEEETKKERDRIVGEARAEGEEIIAKAQQAEEKLREQLEKEMDQRGVDFGMELMTKVLSEKAKGMLDKLLIEDFISKLKDMDLSRITADVTEVEVVSLTNIEEAHKSEILSIVKEKLGRDMSIKNTIQDDLGGGIVLKFGSMALDGSIKQAMYEEAEQMKSAVEMRV